ncbi:adenylate/guanylate cyclase domain-containing protein [bacterium]|nr:adenylate/guanylate cyclase domain-containing protein [bacterium]
MNYLNATKKVFAVFLVSFGALVGGAYAVLTVEKSAAYFYYGAADGVCITLLVLFYQVSVLGGGLGARIRRMAFGLTILFNFLAYTVCFFLGSILGRWISQRPGLPVIDGQFIAAVGFALFLLFLITFLLEMNRLVGSRVLWNFIRGTYHRPVEEDRIFLFIDLADSTAIAERLGNQKYIEFINLFFRALSRASVDTGAEIYKYVGDEAILTWRNTPIDMDPCAIRCFFLFEEYLRQNRQEFARKFGVHPEYRGAIHEGLVIVGELGTEKAEIAFLGDVVNSTARLMGVARDHGASLIASEDFLREGLDRGRLNVPSVGDVALRPLGVASLRGKKAQIRVFSVEKEPTP